MSDVTLLDDVLWNALGTHHAEFARSAGNARRYHPEVSSLAAVRDAGDPGAWADLATLMDWRERAGLLLWVVPDVGPALCIRATVPSCRWLAPGPAHAGAVQSLGSASSACWTPTRCSNSSS